MLMTKSGRKRVASLRPLENWPSVRIPFSSRTCLVGYTTRPNGEIPALAGSMMSAASRRARASAIWLRQVLPTQTKRTFRRCDAAELSVRSAAAAVSGGGCGLGFLGGICLRSASRQAPIGGDSGGFQFARTARGSGLFFFAHRQEMFVDHGFLG